VKCSERQAQATGFYLVLMSVNTWPADVCCVKPSRKHVDPLTRDEAKYEAVDFYSKLL